MALSGLKILNKKYSSRVKSSLPVMQLFTVWLLLPRRVHSPLVYVVLWSMPASYSDDFVVYLLSLLWIPRPLERVFHVCLAMPRKGLRILPCLILQLRPLLHCRSAATRSFCSLIDMFLYTSAPYPSCLCLRFVSPSFLLTELLLVLLVSVLRSTSLKNLPTALRFD